MPAETHTHRDPIDARSVVDLIASIIGIDPDDAAGRSLAAVGLDDDLAVFDLWSAIAEELGERSLGDFDPPEPAPTTVGELAEAFQEALS